LTEAPIDENAIFVFMKTTGLAFFKTIDYTYDPGTQTVTLTTPLIPGEEILIKYMCGSGIDVVP
jgi:hypothetical protein